MLCAGDRKEWKAADCSHVSQDAAILFSRVSPKAISQRIGQTVDVDVADLLEADLRATGLSATSIIRYLTIIGKLFEPGTYFISSTNHDSPEVVVIVTYQSLPASTSKHITFPDHHTLIAPS